MEEMNKDIINEEVETVEETEVVEEIADVPEEEIEVLGEVPHCCCCKKAKVSINAICVWVASVIALFFGANSALSIAKQLKELVAQAAEAGGTLADFGIGMSDIISTIGTSVVPMFVYAVVLYAIGRILWVQKNK